MLVALVLGFVALAASVVGLAIPYWLYSNVAGIRVYEGLWEFCSKAGEISGCVSLTASDALRATQAMEVIGMILIALAVLMIILKLTVMKSQTKLPAMAGVLMIVAGLCMLIGTVIYGTKVRKQSGATSKDLHAGFGLSVAGGVVAIVAGVLFIRVGQRAGSYAEI